MIFSFSYPGHFAFASPHGFGVWASLHQQDTQQVSRLQETLSYTPFLEPVAVPGRAVSSVALLPPKDMMTRVQAPQAKAEQEKRAAFELKFSPTLASRDFSAPGLTAERVFRIQPDGEVQADIRLVGI